LSETLSSIIFIVPMSPFIWLFLNKK